jgi:transcriptional regulator with XRE-family HTH domain
MESLGKKIKKIRTELQLKQGALHPNQSAIAQIERGNNKNPSPDTIRIIAENLNKSMEELVKGTDWKAPQKMTEEGKYGYSELDFDLQILPDGKIDIHFRSYPRYDSNGIENKYCPISSSRLLFECKICKKPITASNQIFCMGCGENIFQVPEFNNINDFFKKLKLSDYELKQFEFIRASKNDPTIRDLDVAIDGFYMDNMVGANKDILAQWYYLEVKNNPKKLKAVIRYVSSLIHDYYSFGPNWGDSFNPSVLMLMKEEGDDVESFFSGINAAMGVTRPEDAFYDLDEYCKGLKAKDDKVYNFHLDIKFKELFKENIIDELRLELEKIDTINGLSVDEEE